MDISSFLIGYEAGKNSVASGDGGSSSGEVWAMKDGKFEPTSGIHTVTHNIGVVPELVIVHVGAVPPANCQFFAIGFNAAMSDLFEANTQHSMVGLIISSSTGGGFLSLGSQRGIETNGDTKYYTGAQAGFIRDATATTFTVGGSGVNVYDTSLVAGTTYYWRAYYKKP